MKPDVLQMSPFLPQIEAFLNERFIVHPMPLDADAREALLRETGPRIRGIATTAAVVIDETMICRLPALRIVACQGAGLDNIDIAAAERRGIRVTGTSRVLAAEVADVAMALILCVTRRLCEADRFVRAGHWRNAAFPLGHTVHGRKLGILGFGSIGSQVAARAAAFGMDVGYYGPRRKPEVSLPYFADLTELASWADVLVVSCPGGAATRHLVGRDVLSALGPEGWLINVARGSIVDEAALVAALQAGTIAGAGLDVFEHEPEPAEALLGDDRVVLLPHIGSAAIETRIAMGRAMVTSIQEELAR